MNQSLSMMIFCGGYNYLIKQTISMPRQYVWIGLAVGLFFAGLGVSYAIFINTYNPYTMMGNSTMFSQMMGRNPQFSGQYMGYMMQDPTLRNQTYSYMFQNQPFMQGMMQNPQFQQYMRQYSSNLQTNYTGPQGQLGSGMMGGGGMMPDVPKDVIIRTISSQQVPVGKDAQIEILVLDKKTDQPLTNAQVILGIEKGAPMSTMDMQGGMFYGENLGDGKYLAKFKLDEPGYYTLHTHVIPPGQSMMAMMNNHMDIGIIVK